MRDPGETITNLLVDDRGIIVDTLSILPDSFQGEKIDLQESHVFPGFTDTHTHSFEGGLYSFAANLGHCRSLSDLFAELKNYEPIDGILVGFNFDENLIGEKRFPSKKELDTHFSYIPVLLRRIDGHSVQINSKLKQMIEEWGNITLPGNEPYRGKWNDYVCHQFHRNISEDWVVKAYKRGATIGIKSGHTTIHSMIGDAASDPLHYQLIAEMKGEFALDLILYPQIFDVNRALQLKSHRVGGCILADGSFGSHTAALTRPYCNDKNNSGRLYKSDDEWDEFITMAHNSGLQVAVHCIGDAAIKQILRAYIKAERGNRQNLRHQIIHCELIEDDEVIDLMSEYSIAAVMQPAFDRLWGGENGFYAALLGRDRALNCNRFRSLVRGGVLVTGGSDWYITDLDALAGIDAAVNHHNEKERLEPYEAIKLYTSNAARLTGEEDRFGELVAGKQADLVCLSENPLESENIAAIGIKKVVKCGRILYSNDL
jgi:predicted amidohydrolase YtcJ